MPLVTVIIAAYNRSQVLRHAVRSVLDSTVRDLELVVVGDGCSDDTGEVLSAIADPRLRFINLARNSGGQSVPHNHGLSLATGRYVAFLNQDDLYFPDHLERTIHHLGQSGGDFVWTPTYVLFPTEICGPDSLGWRVVLGSTPPALRFDPETFCVASSWVVDRRALPQIGPWRSADEMWVSPSQDWIYRASVAGLRMSLLPHPSVIVIHSGHRASSYTQRASPEHDFCAARLRDDRFRRTLAEAAAVHQSAALEGVAARTAMRRLVRSAFAPARWACTWFGLHPMSAHQLIHMNPRGTLVRWHRHVVGLPPA